MTTDQLIDLVRRMRTAQKDFEAGGGNARAAVKNDLERRVDKALEKPESPGLFDRGKE
jgi:hypothetical protein